MSTFLSDGLTFSVSPPCKKSKSNNDDSENTYMLILAPFNKIPKINFGQVKLNKQVERALLIVNPQEFNLKLFISCDDLDLNKIELNIDQKTTINFKIVWKPTKCDKYKFKIDINIENSRLKFTVNAFGECIEEKKPRQTNLTVLKSIKPAERNKIEPSNKCLKPICLNVKPTVVSKTPKKPSISNSITPTRPPLIADNTTFVSNVTNESTLTDERFRRDTITDSPRYSQLLSTLSSIPRSLSCDFRCDDDIGDITLIRATSIQSMFDYNDENNTQKLPIINSTFICNTKQQDQQQFETFSKRNTKILNSTVIKTTTTTTTRTALNGYTCIKRVNEFKNLQDLYRDSSSEDEENYKTCNESVKLINQTFNKVKHDIKTAEIKKLNEIKQVKAAICIQKWTRSMKQRYLYLRQRRAIYKVQQLWRKKYEKRVKAAKSIQNWTRSMKQRYLYLRQRRAIIALQQQCRIYYQKRVKAAICIQRWSRSMKDRFLYLKQRRAICVVQQLWRVRYQTKVNAALCIQKWTRSMKERYEYLNKRRLVCKIQNLWRVKYTKRVKAAICLQQWTRSMSQRYIYLRQYRAICIIQRLWRVKYGKRVEAAVKIQNWTRSMKQRYIYLRERRAIYMLQKIWKMKFKKKVQAAICIQEWTRSMKQRYLFLRQHKAICKIQQIWRQKYIKRKHAAICIENAWLKYKKHKEIKIKSAIKIQTRWRDYKSKQKMKLKAILWQNTIRTHVKLLKLTKIIHLEKQLLIMKIEINRKKLELNAVNTIKRYWRRYKFRKNLNRYRQAAICIQNWTRSMKERFYYLRLKRTTYKIQAIWRYKYSQLTLSALKIQLAYRKLMIKKLNMKFDYRLHSSACLIQAAWKGYKVRKEYKTCLIKKKEATAAAIMPISETTICEDNTTVTIGYKFNQFLEKLLEQSNENEATLTISQLLHILCNLCHLTSLSNECCIAFVNSKCSSFKLTSIDILFKFLNRCNRSIPHIDLISLCLKLIINLLKCKYTFNLVLNQFMAEQLYLIKFLQLLQQFYVNNTKLFMNCCLIVSLMIKYALLCKKMDYLNFIMNENNGACLKTLLKLKQLIDKRSTKQLLSSSINSDNYVINTLAINKEIDFNDASFNDEMFAKLNDKDGDDEISIANLRYYYLFKLNFSKPCEILDYLLIKVLKIKFNVDCKSVSVNNTAKSKIVKRKK